MLLQQQHNLEHKLLWVLYSWCYCNSNTIWNINYCGYYTQGVSATATQFGTFDRYILDITWWYILFLAYCYRIEARQRSLARQAGSIPPRFYNDKLLLALTLAYTRAWSATINCRALIRLPLYINVNTIWQREVANLQLV